MVTNSNEKITIIIPIYQAEKYLADLLDSIINQTFSSFKCLLINDGSSDRSVTICEFYMQKYPHVFNLISQSNKGVSSARNLGLDHMVSPYVTFVDADDILHPQYLETLLFLKESNNVQVAEISRIEFIKKPNLHLIKANYEADLYHSNRIIEYIKNAKTAIIGKLYDAEIFESIRFHEGLIDDAITTPIILSRIHSAVIGHDKLYMRRYVKNSISHNKNYQTYNYFKIATIISSDSLLKQKYPKYRDNLVFKRLYMYFSLHTKHQYSGSIEIIYNFLEKTYPNWRNNNFRDITLSMNPVYSKVKKFLFLHKFYKLNRLLSITEKYLKLIGSNY
jgi:glycosyltransferase involved in cell wall biosynthesis